MMVTPEELRIFAKVKADLSLRKMLIEAGLAPELADEPEELAAKEHDAEPIEEPEEDFQQADQLDPDRSTDRSLRPDGHLTPEPYVLPMAEVSCWKVLERHINAGYFPDYFEMRGRSRWWKTSDLQRWQVWKSQSEYRENYQLWKRRTRGLDLFD